MENGAGPELVTLREAAELVGVPLGRLRGAVKAGRLPTQRVPGKGRGGVHVIALDVVQVWAQASLAACPPRTLRDREALLGEEAQRLAAARARATAAAQAAEAEVERLRAERLRMQRARHRLVGWA